MDIFNKQALLNLAERNAELSMRLVVLDKQQADLKDTYFAVNNNYCIQKQKLIDLEHEIEYKKSAITQLQQHNETLLKQVDWLQKQILELKEEKNALLDRLLENNNTEQIYSTVAKPDISQFKQPRTLSDLINEQRDAYYAEQGAYAAGEAYAASMVEDMKEKTRE